MRYILAILLIVLAASISNAADLADLNRRADQFNSHLVEGRYGEAAEIGEALIADVRDSFGAESVDYARLNTFLAMAYAQDRQFKRAEEVAMVGMDILRRQLGEFHEETLWSTRTLAQVYMDMHEFAKAERLYLSLINRSRTVAGNKAPLTLYLRHQYAGSLGNQGKFKEAKETYTALLADQRETLGESNPETLRTIFNLAGLYDNFGHDEESISLLEQYFVHAVAVLGQDNQQVLRAKLMLVGVYLTGFVGREDEAEVLLESVASSLEHLPEDKLLNYRLEKMRFRLARSRSQLEEASKNATMVARLALELFGYDSDERLMAILDLASVQLTRRQHSEARRLLDEAAMSPALEVGFAGKDADLVRLDLEGRLHHQSGQLEEAKHILSEVYSERRDLFGEADFTTVGTLLELAMVHLLTGSLEAVSADLRRAEQAVISHHNPQHPRRLLLETILASVSLLEGRTEGVEDEVRDILARADTSHNGESDISILARYMLAGILYEEGRPDSASEILAPILEDSNYRAGHFDKMIEYLSGEFPHFSELAE